MSEPPVQSRMTNRTATATTLVALLAVAASTSFASASRSIVSEGRMLSESQAVRLVAAAVAAAARDLAGAETTDVLGDLPLDVQHVISAPEVASTAVREDREVGPQPLREALLSLPPPAA